MTLAVIKPVHKVQLRAPREAKSANMSVEIWKPLTDATSLGDELHCTFNQCARCNVGPRYDL